MKNFKKVTAAIAATLMAATMVAPMAMNSFAEDNSTTLNVGATTENNSDQGVHTYEAYQIFSASDISDGVLTGIEWGSGIDSEKISDIYTALGDILDGEESPFKDVKSAKEVADALGAYTIKDNEVVKQFADVVANYLSETKTSEVNSKLTIAAVGYYLVQDADNSPTAGTGENAGNNSGAKTRYILNVVEANTEITVNPKSSAPTVDKQVLDETTEGTPIVINDDGTFSNGDWYEEADHAINETFQFKLIATIPAELEMDSYDKYHVTFMDSMSDGVTFEKIASVKVYTGEDDNTGKAVGEYTENNKNGYYATTVDENNSWSLTIADVKAYLAENGKLSDGVTIEVIYNAHLNENAIKHNVSNGDGEAYKDDDAVNINYNDVFLKYSNNPNFNFGGESDTDSKQPEDEDEEGKTPKDTVGVFTYTVDNTKIDDSNTPLNGAKFNLYAGDTTEGSDPIDLVYDDTLGAYRMPKSGETGNALIESQGTDNDGNATGKFNFVGLDAGTYTLKEIEAPAGYNLAADVKIQIVATHEELEDGNGAKLDLKDSKNMSNTIIDQKGTSLPSTGGMGTKLFYLGGGAMVAVAGIFLITKKRMKKEEL